MGLPWQWSLPSNGALDIQQLWAFGGRTCEPILMKFGIQQQIRTTVTVMLLESIRNAITRLQTYSGRIPSCSQYWKLIYTITPLTMGPNGTTLG